MKLLCSVLLIALAVNGVFTLPARNSPQDDAEVISVPQRRPEASDLDFNDFKGVVDTAFLQPRPSIFNFNLGLSNSFDDIFRRLRGRIWPIVVDSDESGTGGADDSDETAGTLGFGLRPLKPLDPKNGNTTSTVKVVDGHKVEINETTYGDTNSLFKVRVVNVRPLESGEEVVEGVINNRGDFKPVSSPSTESPPKRSELDESNEEDDRREPLEKQPKDNEVRDIDEPQSTTSTTTTTTTTTTKATTAKSILASSSSLEAVAEDSLADSTDIRHTIMADLIEDVLQQQEEKEEQLEMGEHQEQLATAQDAGTMAHNEETETPLPDSDSHNAADEQQAPESLAAIENFGDESESESESVLESESEMENLQLEQMQMQLQLQQMQREREELESSDDEDVNEAPVEMSDTFNDEWAEHADPSNDLNNHIDIYDNFVPVDLSNDIAVNDAAAANPDFPYNPDAELIEVPAAVPTMPKFEKLSLMPPTPLMK